MNDISRDLLAKVFGEMDQLRRGIQAHEKFNEQTKAYVLNIISDIKKLAAKLDLVQMQLTDLQRARGRKK